MIKIIKKSFIKTSQIALVGIVAFSMLMIPTPNVGKTEAASASAMTGIQKVSVSLASSTKSANTNYIYTLQGVGPVADNSDMHINAHFMGDHNNGGHVNFNNATFSSATISGTVFNHDNDYLMVRITSGTNDPNWSFTLSGVINPSVEGAYNTEVRIYAPGEQPGQNEMGTSAIFAVGNPSVMGTVRLADNSPLNGGYLNLFSENNPEANYGSNISDGNYMIFNVPAGTYTMNVWANPGDIIGQIAPMGQKVTVVNNQTVTKNLKFTEATKYVVGKVQRKNGEAITNATVEAHSKSGSHVEANTNSNGRFSLACGPGEWDLQVSPRRNNQGQQIAVDWIFSNNGRNVVNFANNSSDETVTQNFKVDTTDARLKGKIVKPNGQPAKWGWVNVMNPMSHGGSGISTNEQGEFNISVMSGTYILEYSSQDQSMYLDSVKTTVGTNQTKDLGTLTLKQKTSRLTGKIVNKQGQGISDIEMNFWSPRGAGWGRGISNGSGEFSVLMAPGTYEGQPWMGDNADYVYMGEPKSVTVVANQTKSLGNVVLTDADATINITVQNAENNQTLSDLFGFAFVISENGGFIGSDIQRGQVSLRVPHGTYKYNVDTWDSEYTILSGDQLTVAKDASKNVTVKAYPNNSNISGHLVDENGKTITGVQAFVFAETAGTWKETMIDPKDGSYSLGVLGGDDMNYFIGAHSESQDYINQEPFGKPPVNVPANKTVANDILMLKADATIEVEILDPDGNRIPWGFAWASNRFHVEENDLDVPVIDTGSEGKGGSALIGVKGNAPGTNNYVYEVGTGMGPEFSTYLPPEMQEVTPAIGETVKITMQMEKADAYIIGTITTSSGSSIRDAGVWAYTENGRDTFVPTFGGNTYRLPVKSGETWYIGADAMANKKHYRVSPEAVAVPSPGEYSKDLVLLESSYILPDPITVNFDSASPYSILLDEEGLSRIEIPAGAMADEGNVTVTVTPKVDLMHEKGKEPLAFALDIEARDSDGQEITQLNQNISITFKVTDAMLAEAGANSISELSAAYVDESTNRWSNIDRVTIDQENYTVTMSVNHLTVFSPITSSGSQGQRTPKKIVTGVGTGDGPHVQVFGDKDDGPIASFFAYDSNARFGVNVASGDLNGDGNTEIITGPGEGGSPEVKIFNDQGSILGQFMAYDSNSRFGVRVAVGDTNGDGTKEIVTVPGDGAPGHVKVWNDSGTLLSSFFAFDTTDTNSAHIALGDTSGNGKEEIIVGSGGKGEEPAHVRIYNDSAALVSEWSAYEDDGWNTGVTVAAGDLNGDGTTEVVTGTQTGKGPHVKVWNPINAQLLSSFMAYESTARFGVNVAVGDLNADGNTEIITAPGQGGGPHIKTWDYNAKLLMSFFPYNFNLRSGVNLATGDL
ncbi:MAG: hypothetical protein ABIE68_01215 [bacterium]